MSDAANLASDERTSVRVIVGGLDGALSELPPRLRHRRLRSLTTVLFSLLLSSGIGSALTGRIAPQAIGSAGLR